MADPVEPVTRVRRPWALTFFGLLAIAGLIAMPILAGAPDGEKMPDMVRFLGHFHPVLLHLPIGVFSLILFQELGLIFFRRGGERRETTLFPMFFGAASAILAVVAGFLLYHGGGYEDNALADRHLWGGLIFAVIAVLTFVIKAWTAAVAGNQAFYRLLLFGSVAVMGFASHDGASITHGSSYLTDYAPAPIRKLLGLEVNEKPKEEVKNEDQIVYADIVAPIFERRCVQCHKADKAKGRLRMDTFDLLVKGGKEGEGIIPGDADNSNIVIRMELEEDDDERMPPEGKPQVEPHELVIIKWWLDSGADPAKKLSEFEIPAPVQQALKQLAPFSAPAGAEAKPVAPGDDLKSLVAQLSNDFPGALGFESEESPNLTFTAVSLRGNLDDDGFKKIESVIPQLVTVDLSATKVTDATVALLSSAENLRLIRLAETGVTDVSLETLLKLQKLESINLYGTQVTDAGVRKLAGLTNLKRLFLWQTAVSPETIAILKEKLPGCEITTGI
jgi:uncharacterized membrane protein